MSAAKWRSAMSTGVSAGQGLPMSHAALEPSTPPSPQTPPTPPNPYAHSIGPRWWAALWSRVHWRHAIVMVALLLMPLVLTPFLLYQVAAQSLILGLIALSLSFLAGYGGMVSLAQMSVAGMAGYAVAVLGVSGTATSLNWPWGVAVPLALMVAVVASTLIGWLSVRTDGIYTIMITLAIGVAFYYFALQNYSLFNGFQGFHKVQAPTLWGISWHDPVPYYFLAVFWALSCYFLVKYLLRAPFGMALQGVRDNARRMSALGFNVTAHRVASYAVAGAIAAIGGVLLVWYNSLITPGTIGTGALINILVIAVLGGMRHPIGAFIGAVVFVLLQNFAIDLVNRERFNLVIGIVFLIIVLFSPDGLLGWWVRLRKMGSGLAIKH